MGLENKIYTVFCSFFTELVSKTRSWSVMDEAVGKTDRLNWKFENLVTNRRVGKLFVYIKIGCR